MINLERGDVVLLWFARAAGHDGGNAVVRLQRGQQGVQGFGLVGLR